MATTQLNQSRTNNPFGTPFDDSREVEDWEDWEDDEPGPSRPGTSRQNHGAADGDDVLIDFSSDDSDAKDSGAPALKLTTPGGAAASPSSSAVRHSVQKPVRLKSRHRQKAQNAKAGIRLVTDMTKLRTPAQQQQQQQQQPKQQHVADQLRPPPENTAAAATGQSHEEREGKFVDAAALRALEGDPNSASVGSWNWLKKRPSNHARKPSKKGKAAAARTPTTQQQQQDLSPADRPIVIGIAVPEGDRAAHEVSPQTAVLETPVGLGGVLGRFLPKRAAATGPAPPGVMTTNAASVSPLTPKSQQGPQQQRSFWSPDTESSAASSATSPFRSSRVTSSIYSQMTTAASPLSAGSENAPPVPALPAHLTGAGAAKGKGRVESLAAAESDEDAGSPNTLFEEDGASPRSPEKGGKAAAASKAQSGWWEHVTTPFVEQSRSAFAASPPRMPQQRDAEQPRSPEDRWWAGKDQKKSSGYYAPGAVSEASDAESSSRSVPFAAGGAKKASPQLTGSTLDGAPSSSSASSLSSRRQSRRGGGGTAAAPLESLQDKARILAEEDGQIPAEEPPPYSPPSSKHKQQHAIYTGILPSQRTGATTAVTTAHSIPSPGPVSPAFQRIMAGHHGGGAIGMSDIPLSPAVPAPAVVRSNTGTTTFTAFATPLPERPAGSAVPGDHFHSTLPGPMHRVERQRRRHEKEDAVARRVGGFWRGRGCIPEGGCYGRTGREGRKRRRICFGVCAGLLLAVALVVALVVTLTARRPDAVPFDDSMWLNITGFPPVPTGVLTVAGTENTDQVTGCVQPPTLWSCSLPKELHDSVLPYQANQPSLVLQIQFDNNTRQLWDFTGEPPHPAAQPTAKPTAASTAAAERPNFTGISGGLPGSLRRRFGARLAARQQPQFDPGVHPFPAPPSFQEQWFLGNATDDVQGDAKAGEPTPFYISLLRTVNDTVGPNVLLRRAIAANDSSQNLVPSANLSALLPPEELNPDGTGAPARFFPAPLAQQPLRLFDRGLPTEHLGFYTYFNRTLYLKSTAPLTGSSPTDPALRPVPADQDGGCLETEANFVVTWAETRFKVAIWTRMQNVTRLLGNGTRPGSEGAGVFAQPGTFPYPITVTTDTHGGNPAGKLVYQFSVDSRQHISRADAKLIENNLGFGGSWINPRVGGDPTFGGFDGGDGGCRCEWVNFRNVRAVGG